MLSYIKNRINLSTTECHFLGILVAFISFIQCSHWMTIGLFSATIYGLIIALSTVWFLWLSYKTHHFQWREYYYLYIYVIWIVICSVLAFPYLSNNSYVRVYINHVAGTLALSSVVFIAYPKCLSYILSYWRNYTVLLSIILLPFLITFHAFGFYINILQIFLLLFFVLNRKTQVIVGIIFLFTIITSITGEGNTNRAAFVKYASAFIFGLIPLFRFFIKPWMFRTFQIVCFLLPIYFVYLAILGSFNFFENVENQNKKNEMLSDTRSLVYREAIASSYENGYYIWGRTPARGYDSRFELYRSGLSERSSEVSMINMLTWYGVIGMILYTILFWCITSKGLFESRNIYVKVIALYLCFKFVIAWIEDANKFDSTNITLWIMMSICALPNYRNMSNRKIVNIFKMLNY